MKGSREAFVVKICNPLIRKKKHVNGTVHCHAYEKLLCLIYHMTQENIFTSATISRENSFVVLTKVIILLIQVQENFEIFSISRDCNKKP